MTSYTILTHIKDHDPEFVESFDNIEDAKTSYQKYCGEGPQTDWEEGIEIVQDYDTDEFTVIDYFSF